MFVWFAAVSITMVALVFGSPDLDYRLVMLGSVLPLAEGVFGGCWLLHSVVFNAALLLGVMVVARGRRPTQRRWLALPIGTFCHLVLDGTWADTGVFWWPFTGLDSLGRDAVSEFERLPIVLLLEAVGLMVGWWAWRRFSLSDRSVRQALLTEGRLSTLGRR